MPLVAQPRSACIACGSPTHLLYPARRRGGAFDGTIPAEEVACTSPYLGEYEDIFSCRACGLAYQAPPAAPDALAEAYSDVADALYLSEEDRRREEFRELLGRVEAYQGPGRLLEVGSFAGLCLDEAQKRGWTPVGVEPSRWAGDHARISYGVEVVTGTLADAPWEPETFDAACMWDVLEHLPDPLADLERMHRLLKPGGLAAFTTIDIQSRGSRILRKRWPWLMHMHLFYFTPRSLELLVGKAGFTSFLIERHPKRFRVSYMLKRAERYLGPLARAGSRAARSLRLEDRVVTFDLGDIVLVLARKG